MAPLVCQKLNRTESKPKHYLYHYICANIYCIIFLSMYKGLKLLRVLLFSMSFFRKQGLEQLFLKLKKTNPASTEEDWHFRPVTSNKKFKYKYVCVCVPEMNASLLNMY